MPRRRKSSFLYRHSLSLVAVGLLIVWTIGYRSFDPKTHLGAFFGNAIADWSGSVVIILGTKFLYEVGSAESRPVRGKERSPWLTTLRQHSLLIFIVVTGVGWTILFLRMNVDSKMGSGGRQYCIRMGPDGRSGLSHQTISRDRLQGE